MSFFKQLTRWNRVLFINFVKVERCGKLLGNMKIVDFERKLVLSRLSSDLFESQMSSRLNIILFANWDILSFKSFVKVFEAMKVQRSLKRVNLWFCDSVWLCRLEISSNICTKLLSHLYASATISSNNNCCLDSCTFFAVSHEHFPVYNFNCL